MLSLDDPRWETLEGGYRVRYDARALLAKLYSGLDTKNVWHDLWNGLHHQGDVGTASYAAVPHLVESYPQRGAIDWNTYAIVATIELARGRPNNPQLPGWFEKDYFDALEKLAQIGISELPKATEPPDVRAILSFVAISKGSREYGRFLLECSEEELLEIEREFLQS